MGFDKGTSLATKGLIGSGVPLVTKGMILKVSVQVVTVTPVAPVKRGSSAAKPEAKEKEKRKLIKVTVFYNGKKYVQSKYVDPKISISAKNVDVSLDDEKPKILIDINTEI